MQQDRDSMLEVVQAQQTDVASLSSKLAEANAQLADLRQGESRDVVALRRKLQDANRATQVRLPLHEQGVMEHNAHSSLRVYRRRRTRWHSCGRWRK